MQNSKMLRWGKKSWLLVNMSNHNAESHPTSGLLDIGDNKYLYCLIQYAFSLYPYCLMYFVLGFSTPAVKSKRKIFTGYHAA